MRRRIFIGDIQGCREELERLLDAVRFDPATDQLEPAGDMVNRGPDSLGVLRLLRQLGAQGVLGNHDVHLLRVASGARGLGRRDTFLDVLRAPDLDELAEWLRQRPFVRFFHDAILVHAGLNPAWKDPVATLSGLDPMSFHWDSDFATRVRYCTAVGRRPRRDDPPPPWPFRPWYEHWSRREDRVMVFGHWAKLGLVDQPRVKGLDTGCVWGGRLTAWIPEESRIVHVQAGRPYASLD
jgi:bis(5'-nucleosyl)-tetraphosphatase (symmetrical)